MQRHLSVSPCTGANGRALPNKKSNSELADGTFASATKASLTLVSKIFNPNQTRNASPARRLRTIFLNN